MSIEPVIAAFERSFDYNFKHTAKVKYNVAFANPNIGSIKENLQILKINLQSGNVNNVRVEHDFTIANVEFIESLLDILISKYVAAFGLEAPPNQKIYTLIQQVRMAEKELFQVKDEGKPSLKELAKEVLKEILAPPSSPKLTRKQQIEAAAKAKSMERALDYLGKRGAKKGS
jgi:hypothetical protein